MNEKIALSEIKKEVFTDSFQASLVAEDCKRLLSSSIENVDELKSQQWYNRLWKTISGGNIQSLASQARTTQEAQLLLLNVLEQSQVSLQYTNQLVYLVSKGLEHVEIQNEKVVVRLNYLKSDLYDIKEDIKHTRELLDVDPLNEYSWKEEDKVLLVKVIVLLSLIDNDFHELERNLLMDRINSFDFSEEAYQEVLSYNGDPQDVITECEHIDSYKMKLVIYKYAVATAFIHDDISVVESDFLKRFSTYLNLKSNDIGKINSYFGVVPKGDLFALLKLLEGDKSKSRAKLKEKIRQKEKLEKEKKETARKKESKKRELLIELEPVLRDWVNIRAQRVSYLTLNPIYSYIEMIRNYENDDFDTYLKEYLNPENIINRYNEEFKKIVTLNLEHGNFDSVSILDSNYKILNTEQARSFYENMFQRCAQDDGGWTEVFEKYSHVYSYWYENHGNEDWGSILKAGAGGYAAAFILGPVGILAGLGGGYLYSKYKEEELKKDTQELFEMFDQLVGATDSWLQSAFHTSYEFFEFYADKILTLIENSEYSAGLSSILQDLENETNEYENISQ